MTIRTRLTLALAAGALLAPLAAFAQQPVRGLADLVGARGRDGEAQLNSRGYQFVGGEKTADSSYTYWLEPRTNRCVSVRTTDGRYAAIVYAPDADCKKAQEPAKAPVPPPAAKGEDSWETVCGVETGGQTYRYRCHLRNENCNSGGPCRTRLYLPDNKVVITWHSDGSATVQSEGASEERCAVDEKNGQTRFVYGGTQWFVYRSQDWAARELAKMKD